LLVGADEIAVECFLNRQLPAPIFRSLWNERLTPFATGAKTRKKQLLTLSTEGIVAVVFAPDNAAFRRIGGRKFYFVASFRLPA
jgi:hypothetical protein